jgi:feruloyl esterase
MLAPSIGFKVLLPTQTWTQRYLQVGCGGLCGRISIDIGAAQGCVPVAAGGFVIAATDMGHQGMSGEFGRDPGKREDFAHRAVHLTALASKKLIRTFYGRSEAYSYFDGCSDGGREALVEAQRYPRDFNGIIAGAPAMNFQVQNGIYHAWQASANKGEDGKAILIASRLPLLHKAVLKQCDGLDGQVDGLISDPRACHFDPEALLCRSAQSQGNADCLTAAEVAAARRIYDVPRDPATGEKLTIGGPQPGSELAWDGVFVPKTADEPIFSEKTALDALRNLVFESNPPPGFSLHDMRFEKATLDRLRPLHPLYDATNPDLSAFAAAGGKLILWHGWADPHISPQNTIAYHQAVAKEMGKERAEKFERLYLFPGMYHCGGGEGATVMDLLTPMIEWVERSVAPQAVVARQANRTQGNSSFGQPTAAPSAAARQAAITSPKKERSRPVFPYPFVASYNGSGDPDLASSYVRGAPLSPDDTPKWAGSDFYRPYPFRQR